MTIVHKSSILLLFLLIGNNLLAQKDSTFDISAIVELDSITVTAKRQGFAVEDFIDLVRNDQSFYTAFRNLRTNAYYFNNEISYFDKKGRKIAFYKSRAKQNFDDQCRTMDILQKESNGKYFRKNGKYKFYTSKLYDRLFFTNGKVCESKESTNFNPEENKKGMEGQVGELKKLIFTPGEKAKVPFIGNKTAIFTEKMAKFYKYKISSETYKNEIDAYVFIVELKDEYINKHEGKTVIKYLRTYFDKSNFQVLGRSYQLAHKGALYQFDVRMEIRLEKIKDLYFPTFISYDGEWNIPTKKREIAKFKAEFFDFQQ
jgi:hypothetical protein